MEILINAHFWPLLRLWHNAGGVIYYTVTHPPWSSQFLHPWLWTKAVFNVLRNLAPNLDIGQSKNIGATYILLMDLYTLILPHYSVVECEVLFMSSKHDQTIMEAMNKWCFLHTCITFYYAFIVCEGELWFVMVVTEATYVHSIPEHNNRKKLGEREAMN